ncbi:phycobiliprotein lyase [Halotia branconii]|uniref:Chromophore lyase CpcS/CpeS n=1 Tax=Halotia branconii CENA392 TaxID=1539056 RepID=A0AAJ6NRN7_9CYAN|nr:phycobiliprotein lyase [Halotia branconii]WGV25450.1 phycobiliprotein lyase [Halotia branconii CENA392]
MNIEEFFQLSAGKWFSHRTSHHLAFNKSEDGKSDIIIEMLAADHPEVIKLCQLDEIIPNSAACGAKVTWNGTIEQDQKKHSGSTVLVLVPDVDKANEGKLLRETGDTKKALVTGHYKIGTDEALILTTESETICSEERLWFASPNLRMRVLVIKRADGFSTASFTSEIRMGGSPAAAKVSEAANPVSS